MTDRLLKKKDCDKDVQTKDTDDQCHFCILNMERGLLLKEITAVF